MCGCVWVLDLSTSLSVPDSLTFDHFAGVKKVAVLCPGFLTDCLETIDENGTENAKIFQENGGEELVLVPCLNSDPVWCQAAADIIRTEASGWLPQSS